jgi:predicted methyltransferase
MRHAVVALGLTLALAAPHVALAQKVPAPIAAAVAAADRPDADKARDANRKPAEMMMFAEVKPGEKVAELLPGGGYFTRIFSSAVGDSGKVYAVAFGAGDPVKAIAASPGHANVTVLPYGGPDGFKVPELVDLVWTSQNYHDAYNGGAERAATLDSAAFKALKPGGIYIVLDHVGLPDGDNKTFHRIDPAVVKAQVLAAGFQYVGESKALANPADPHNIPVRDPAIQGKTDQFIMKFRKPK